MTATTAETAAAREAVATNPLWYHTMELAPGVVTPGWFDLRPIVEHLPWPDVRGKRCLDVGPYDGFLAFELERRGAAEVVATDISGPEGWDWGYRDRLRGPAALAAMTGGDPGRGLRIAKELLGSSVERVEVNVYDLTPERVGTFDFVVCGSLMLHLRDPVRALEAIRGVCRERFLSAETIGPLLTLLGRRRPMARMLGGNRCQWWIPNTAGHRLMLEAAGFEVERVSRPYSIRLGPAHPARESRLRAAPVHWLSMPLTGRVGVPHSAALCRPAPQRPAPA